MNDNNELEFRDLARVDVACSHGAADGLLVCLLITLRPGVAECLGLPTLPVPVPEPHA